MDVTCINNRLMSLTINTVPLRISLTNVYAPHAGLTSQTKTDFYDSLAHIVRQQPPHQINLILGDFNARLMEILPGERSILGQFLYRDHESTISNLSNGQLENRKMFIDLCLEEAFLPANTWFCKPTPRLATYRSPTVPTFNASNINTTHYAQRDYILINDRWKNTITDITNIQDTLLDSDHSLQIATLKVKLAKQKKRKNLLRPRYRKPTEEEMGLYNQAVSQYLGTMASSDPCTDFAQSLQLAAKHNLTKIPVTQKKDYISADTWKLIEEKEAAITAGDYARSQTLSPIIKKMARKDRENMILEQLQAADAQGYKWDGLRQHVKVFNQNESNLETQKVI